MISCKMCLRYLIFILSYPKIHMSKYEFFSDKLLPQPIPLYQKLWTEKSFSSQIIYVTDIDQTYPISTQFSSNITYGHMALILLNVSRHICFFTSVELPSLSIFVLTCPHVILATFHDFLSIFSLFPLPSSSWLSSPVFQISETFKIL